MAGGITFDPAEFEAFKQASGGPAPSTGPAGFDPAEFAAFKAQQTGTDTGRETGALNAGARGLVDGIPVAGPYILGGIDRADAALRAYQGGTGYGDELQKAQAYGADVKAAHPYASTAGEVAGGIVGTAPLIAAAPAAFGAGTGSLIGRSLISAASGSGLGAADSTVRSGGDINAAGRGAVVGGAFGAAAPAAGAALGAGVRNFYEMIDSRLGPSSGFTQGAANPVVAQAKFLLQENPQLTQSLQNAGSADEAHRLMADAWKFAGYNRPGGENAARLATTQAYAGSLGGGQALPGVASGSSSQMLPGIARPAGASMDSTAQQGGFGLGGIVGQGAAMPGQASPTPDVATLSGQPLSVTGAPDPQPSSQYAQIGNALKSIAAGQQKQGQGQRAGGMPGSEAPGGRPISLQQARAMFDPGKFYGALRNAGVRGV